MTTKPSTPGPGPTSPGPGPTSPSPTPFTATRQPRVVALGGGHGLSASLAALRRLTTDLVAIVTVADDGGSSGRLRAGMPTLLPPGDLRMAMCALAAETAQAQAWASVLQHRFDEGDLEGHPVGNVLLAGLLEASPSPAMALARLAQLVGAVGTVLPLADVPVDIAGDVLGADAALPGVCTVVRGQVALASTSGKVQRAWLEPADPAVSSDVVAAVERAEIITLGPGSLFTSQLPHLLTPEFAAALQRSQAHIVYLLNLEPQPGESDGLDPAGHLETLRAHLPAFRPSVVIADLDVTPPGGADHRRLMLLAAAWGTAVVHCRVASGTRPGEHDPALLADALRAALEIVQDGAPAGLDHAGRLDSPSEPGSTGAHVGHAAAGRQQRTTVSAGGAPAAFVTDQDGGWPWRP